jgi:hypothetical protein
MNANAPHDANAVACDVDNTIDRALSALRDAQPRSGSEMLADRILTSLEHRTATRPPARLHFSSHVALWTAASAVVLALAALIALHHRPAASESARAPQIQGQPNTASLAELQVPAIESPEGLTESALSTRRHFERSAPRRRISVLEDSQAPHSDGLATTPTDAQALADLRAPSHPAPPLPLTPEEKLFMRMLRYGNATQLAELNPIVREQHDDAETTAFKTFFPDPPPLKQPGDTE